ncbi:MAG: His/Gly/Thr/Pro-type tRNA ligase C-terminal domain-containing protein, partial [Planctomycetota bacterium]
PGVSTISELSTLLKVKPKHILKTLVFRKASGGWVLAVVRGDHEVNVAKLQVEVEEPVTLDEVAAKEAGFSIGFVGPGDQERAEEMIVDFDAFNGGFWVAGANEPDYHVKHFTWQRDTASSNTRFQISQSHLLGDRIRPADIRNAVDGDPSPMNDGGVLKESRGVEVGHVFKLGTVYSEKMGATFLDENNAEKPVIMGCYGIGVGRILLSAVETSHDERGIQWPVNIAPYEVVVTPIKYDGVAKEKADAIYDELKAKGVDVLLDDRDDRPGSKFADADLIGIPLRVVVGDRGLEKGVVELKDRHTGETSDVAVDNAVETVLQRLGALRDLTPTSNVQA